ncbi:MAG TPA: conjugal transfer protein MobC [Flavisolibacter sp.]|nr:conjugal transfer protein MobC [Flavisolibacter sp.]
MHTGENEQGLRKIMDLTRIISIFILLLHIYYHCYGGFKAWNLTHDLSDRLLLNIARIGFLTNLHGSKSIALVFLGISLLGVKGKKDEAVNAKRAVLTIFAGLFLYFSSAVFLQLKSLDVAVGSYSLVTLAGFLLVLKGGTLMSRLINVKLNGDVFNHLNETFPQEERLLCNEYSINLPARYNLKGKQRKSWINIINPFRGLLVMGSPGSGKSYFIIQHIIKQHIQKGFSMFIYDYKFDDLTKIAYNYYLIHGNQYTVKPRFYVINFDDLERSHRCNPLDPSTLHDISDAAESSRTIMLGLNHEWIKKSGDFFVESPINFVTALIWFLRRYKDGKFCTLPHVIELAQVEYDKLFSILRSEPQIEALINPFVTAYLNDAKEQLEGQIASAKISLSRLASEKLYYILSGNDFTLDINNPVQPKIVCMGNNPQKTQTYGAVLSLYTTALTRVINRKACTKSSLVFDEFPTLYFNGIDHLIATVRSNRVATTIAVQDSSQLKLHYGKDQAEVILNIVGNVISGQVSGDSAKQLSEKFGKILQDRQSIAINRSDTSITKSKQLDLAIPASKISMLSSGEFVGVVADNPSEKIELKAFHTQVVNDHAALKREQLAYLDLPLFSPVTDKDISACFAGVKNEVRSLILCELERMMDTPELADLIIRKA